MVDMPLKKEAKPRIQEVFKVEGRKKVLLRICIKYSSNNKCFMGIGSKFRIILGRLIWGFQFSYQLSDAIKQLPRKD